MITIRNKSCCTGCKACSNACPVDAIDFFEDCEGFWYPAFNMDKCINCHKCEKVCPMLKEDHGVPGNNKNFSNLFYSAQLWNLDELTNVSSGGAFWGFARSVLDQTGVVYGAAQDDVDRICHKRVETIENAAQLRRSKYFQSDINDIFQQVETDLKNGKIVLFSGTGCQIAGLNCFLGKECENLFTCEVVCHGVPSALVWRKYREEKEKQKHNTITGLVFRDKSLGWSQNQYAITYSDGTVEKERSTKQLFHSGYLQGLFYRPSCGSCPFSSLPRVADITMADFWKYQGPLLNNGDLGVSLLSVNSKKGLKLLEESKKYLNIEVTSRELAFDSCRHMDEHPLENPQRAAFLSDCFTKGYYHAADTFFREYRNDPLLLKVYRKLRRIAANNPIRKRIYEHRKH